jgi:hypothetical protein
VIQGDIDSHHDKRLSETKTCGHLLILACSEKKKMNRPFSPAIHLYDGVNYRVLRKILLKNGWSPGLQIKILSAKYGLIDATTLIEPYDSRFDPMSAASINKKTLKQLRKLKDPRCPSSIFVNLGVDYQPAVNGVWDALIQLARI